MPSTGTDVMSEGRRLRLESISFDSRLARMYVLRRWSVYVTKARAGRQLLSGRDLRPRRDEFIGALPVGCGPVAVEAMSWGKVKGAYR